MKSLHLRCTHAKTQSTTFLQTNSLCLFEEEAERRLNAIRLVHGRTLDDTN